MGYDLINWQNSPNTSTPINANNLNHMDEGIKNATDATMFGYSATFTADGMLKYSTRATSFSAGTFTSQKDIVTAFISNSVTAVQSGTFAGCTALKTIYVDNNRASGIIENGATESTTKVVYADDDEFINVNEFLMSAIVTLKNRAKTIEDKANSDKTELSEQIQGVKNSALEEFANVNAELVKKEVLANKVNAINSSSDTQYPSTKAVIDFVNEQQKNPNAEIEKLKVEKVNVVDFNTYKTSNDSKVNNKVDSNNFDTYKATTDKAIDKCAKDIASNSALINQNSIKVATDKSTSIVLNDSSDCNIIGLIVYGNSIQSSVPTPTAPVSIDNVNNSTITLYKKNLLDMSKCTIHTNGKAILNSTDSVNSIINFTTNGNTANSGVYIRHTDLNTPAGLDRGYGIDYTKLNGKSITLSLDIQSDVDCKMAVQFTKYSYSYVNISSTKQRFFVTEVVGTSKLNNAICFYLNNVEATVTISNIQIEVSSIATNYEKCNANQVSADCTLCAVNNIADTLTVNADGTGFITQNLLYERLTSGKSQSGHTWQYSTTSLRFYRDDTRYKANAGTPNILCSHFEAKDNEKNTTLDNTIGFTSSTGTGIAIRMLQFDGDVTAWESWLDSNEVYVLVPLKTPIITELSKEQVAEILSLRTYYPSTTVISDCDCQVTYVADTKNYIDNKFNELATAIVAHESEVM